MIGLMLKDLFLMRRQVKTYALFLLFYMVLGVLDIFPAATVTVVTQLIIMMLPLSAFSYDDQAKWDRYALTFPAGRRALVGGRYLFTLVVAAAATLYSLLACVLMSILVDGGSLGENLSSLAVSVGMGFFIVDILIPLCYKLGVERARPYMYIVIFVPMLLLFGAYQLGLFSGVDLSTIDRLPEGVLAAGFALVALLPLLGVIPSYLISCRITDKKEF